jgi:hypothetical protein
MIMFLSISYPLRSFSCQYQAQGGIFISAPALFLYFNKKNDLYKRTITKYINDSVPHDISWSYIKWFK